MPVPWLPYIHKNAVKVQCLEFRVLTVASETPKLIDASWQGSFVGQLLKGISWGWDEDDGSSYYRYRGSHENFPECHSMSA